MTGPRLGVGIVGLTPGRSWGAIAHLPALRALADDFEIVGVANTSLASGEAAAQALGLPRAYRDVAELVAAPEVDIVAVTVKVPHHLAAVKAAIAAGKHVYCEWPLGNGLAEARAMAAQAKAKGIVAVAGTQAMGSVELEHVAKLLADGYVGRVLSVTLVAEAGPGGPAVTPPGVYLMDKANGANMLTIPLGHTLAPLRKMLGEITALSAVLATRRTTATMAATGEVLPRTAPDQVVVAGVLADGAPISIHYRGDMDKGTGLLWEINGEDGVIQLTGPSGHTQYHELFLKGARTGDEALQTLEIPQEAYTGWPEAKLHRNVARLYARMAQDIRTGSRTAPSFDDAVGNHQVIAAIERSAETGARTSPADM